MNPKQELEILRKEKRLAELEAKAGASAPTTTAPLQNPETWGDVASQAVDNFVPSAKQFGKDIAEPFIHPVDTAKNLFGLGKGIVQKLIPGEQADEATANAVGKFLMDRYGTVQNIKNTLAQDPVGALGDLSTAITGGGTAIAKLPMLTSKVGKMGKVGQAVTQVGDVIAKAGNFIDPATLAVKGAGKAVDAGGFIGKHLLGATTGVGADAIDTAYQTGKAGGERATQFTDNMRGLEDSKVVLEEAENALAKMRETRSKNYQVGSKAWNADKTRLDFWPVREKFDELVKSTYHGEHSKVGLDTQKKLKEIYEVIEEWGNDKGAHTAGGLDALKMRLDDMMPNKLDPSQSGRAVTTMRNAVKDIIVRQVPEYADVMSDYEKAINLEKEIKHTLSVGGNPDTAMRKLQSMMRNNVNTNYGERLALGKVLEDQGGGKILDRVAGQNMNKVTPRGLAGLGVTGTTLGSIYSGNPMGLALLPAQSPRIVGEAAHIAGQGARVGKLTKQLLKGVGLTPQRARNVLRSARQEGQIDESIEKQLSSLLGDK
tara:strand:+ start:1089 stop:2717 length:1629 start_codon:yes stop_codon:yes gene_type:complete